MRAKADEKMAKRTEEPRCEWAGEETGHGKVMARGGTAEPKAGVGGEGQKQAGGTAWGRRNEGKGASCALNVRIEVNQDQWRRCTGRHAAAVR